MASRDRRDVRLVGGIAIGFGLLLIAGAVAFVAEVWARRLNCPPPSVACGEGRPLSVFLATPVVAFGGAIALAGWFMHRAGRKH